MTTMLRRWTWAGMLAVMTLVIAQPAHAQDTDERVPRIEEAEAIFQQGLDAFEDEDYGMAYRRFRFVYESYPLHQKTTAAILMAGKALYRSGDYQRAADLLSELIRSHPTSSYLDEARRTLGFAERAQRIEEEAGASFSLGIALPLTPDDAALTQALFNGIRLAVEAHNSTADRVVRMVFRDTKASASGARDAVAALVEDEGVDAIIGPLYSEEASAAARTAESRGVVLVAPLATDETVSRGRRYVFQANPTITTRGEQMARLAVRDLGVRTAGVVAEEGNDISERMAEGFQEEAYRLGADVTFFELLPTERDWPRLLERLGEETLRGVDAVYLPISGRDAQRIIEATLDAFDRHNITPRLLGGKDWHDLPSKQQASAFGVIYTDDFYVDDSHPDVHDFDQSYKVLSGKEPGRLGYVGYDVTRFMLGRIDATVASAMSPEALRDSRVYQGLGTRIDFGSGNTNEAIFFLRYRNGSIELYR